MSYENPRIKIHMSTIEIVSALSEGNPGAVNVIMQLIQNGGGIDPDDLLGGLGSLLSLDNLDCYGSRIWMLFKDICGCELPRMIAVMRACAFGYTTERAVNDAIDGKASIDVVDLCRKVKARLPKFGIELPEPPAVAEAG